MHTHEASMNHDVYAVSMHVLSPAMAHQFPSMSYTQSLQTPERHSHFRNHLL